jgi:Fibronectin type III domain
MKRLPVALFVTVLLTALQGATPVSAGSASGARAFAQVKPAAPTQASRHALPGERQKPAVSTSGRAATGLAPTAPRAATRAALPAVGSAWTSLGPKPIVPPAQVNAYTYGNVSGRVTSLAVDPSNAAVVYLGSAGGGVWKTTDSGATWSPLTDTMVSGAIGAIAIDPLHTNIVYAATGEDNPCIDCPPSRGILKSTDSGATWSVVSTAFDTAASGAYFFFGSIAVDRSDDTRLLAATNQGLYSSTDSGATWSKRQLQTVASPTTVPNGSPSGAVTQVLQDTQVPSQWWAAVSDTCVSEGGDVMVSTDNGANWAVSRSFAGLVNGVDAERISIGVGPGTVTGSTVYAEASSCTQSKGSTPYKFVQGTGWVATAAPPLDVMDPTSSGSGLGYYDNIVAVDPTNSLNVLIGGATVIASSNGGGTWADVGNVYPGTLQGFIHPDFHALAFASTGGIAYAGTDGGAWRTSNLGGDGTTSGWTNLNATLQLTQYYGGFAKDLNTFAGGAQGNGTSGRYASSPAAPNFGQINGGVGGWAQFRSGTQYYTEAQNGDMAIVDTSLLATSSANITANGPCVNPNTPSPRGPSCLDPNSFIAPFVVSPTAPDRIYTGTYRVWRSTSAGTPSDGSSWSAISDWTGGASSLDVIVQMAVRSVATHDVVVVATQSGRLFMNVSADTATGTSTWSEITGDLPLTVTGATIPGADWVSSITINPANPNELWVALGALSLGRVYHTADANVASPTWTDLGGTGAGALPVTIIKGVAVSPKHPATLIAGTDSGAFVCFTCGGAAVPSWSRLGTGLPSTRVQSLSVTDDGANLVAWTSGRGAWAIPLVSLVVTTSTASPTVGATFNVTVAVKQPDGSADNAYRGTIHLTSTDPGAVLPGDYTFTAPDNGSHTSSVTLMTPGSQTVTATDTVPGLVTGTSPSLTVVATVPGAPGILTATGGNASATVNWTAPSFDGGSAITEYRVTTYLGAAVLGSVLTGSTATSYVVTGLANATTYTFKVAAINLKGQGLNSNASNPVTTNIPAGTVAAVPTSLNFNVQAPGTPSSPQTVTLHNNLNVTLHVSSAAFAGSNAGQYSKGTDTCTGHAMAPSGTCTVQVSFAPLLTSFGAFPATLSFTDDGAGSPRTVSLTGLAALDNAAHLYLLDGYGGVHPEGTAAPLAGGVYWGWNIARSLALFPDGTGGYVLDGYGGLHPVGNANQAPQSAYWPGWDIAHQVVLAPWSSKASPAGWTLDGYGGINPFGGAPPIAADYFGWDIARGLVILPDSTPGSVAGYLLDGYGGIHPFGGAPAVSIDSYWGWDIGRGITLAANATKTNPAGWVLDGFGGLHAFGSAPAYHNSPYWGWDIGRGIVTWTGSGSGGWVLDGYGGISAFGAAPAIATSSYWGGWDIATGLAGANSGTGSRRRG